MEQIELCLLHVYSDSDFILQKAKKHTGPHVTGGGSSWLLTHPAGEPDPSAYLPACLSSPSLAIPRHSAGRPPGTDTPGTGTPGRGKGAEEQCRSVGCSELV